jgi:hypothetical protein
MVGGGRSAAPECAAPALPKQIISYKQYAAIVRVKDRARRACRFFKHATRNTLSNWQAANYGFMPAVAKTSQVKPAILSAAYDDIRYFA